MKFLVPDSSGKPSWTYTLAVPAVFLITVWFVVGGLDLTWGALHILTATKTGTDYLAAITPWLAYLGHRRLTGGGPAPEVKSGS